ncbi:MAG: hypothetical protein IPH24_17295 [Crocinitomicaceae bacterium]|jgi:hypothetical protein|nr:hypothetical protein [Crocinitomicaceae bacterium]
MKKSILTGLIWIIITLPGFTQKECLITEHYEDFITVEKTTINEKNYLIKRIVETDKKSCFSDLINNNTTFIDYLLTNFSSNANFQNLLSLTDSIALRKAYFLDLKKDSVFNSVMTELIAKSISKEIPKDTVSMDNLLNIAVKYFSIVGLTEEGYYSGKVCVGLNDIKKTEKERKPFIEAFCFSSILEHYQSEEYSMYDEFVKAIKELYKVNLGIDREEKLLRAQGAMYLLMRNSENLNKMLASEYESNKDYLPFILKTN